MNIDAKRASDCSWDTRTGGVHLKIPKLHQRSYSPALLRDSGVRIGELDDLGDF